MSSPEAITRPAAQPIPTPPDFPVTWENPADERLFWTRDKLHYPDQMTPVQFSILNGPWAPGWRAAAAYYELPVAGPRGRLVNTYFYSTMIPVMAPPEELAARAQRSAEKSRSAVASLGELWDSKWLPETKQHIAHWESLDLRDASTSILQVHLDDAMDRFGRIAEMHFLLNLAAFMATGPFDEFYRDLFGESGTFDSYRLLEGLNNKTMEANRALWRLSREALASPEVSRALQAKSADQVLSTLQLSPAGQSFLANLTAHLREYGYRCDKFFNLDLPCWIEDPTPAIETLRDYAAQPGRDLDAELAEQTAQRERLVAAARERLSGYPQPVVAQFDALLKAAQTAIVLLEDHTFWMEFPSHYHIRRILLEIGRRFTEAGAVARPDDVFYLTLDEIGETAGVEPTINRTGIVAERRAERERFRNVVPPPALGTPPPGPPPDSPFTRLAGKFFGTPARPSGEPGLLNGTPGSPGTARGPAKVVRSLAEWEKLQPGDILIAETTMPAWTPLFATVAAVVTDSGGVLSHPAVVAREYRIPAVVATAMATSVIRDGQIVEVDGDAGTVRIVSPA